MGLPLEIMVLCLFGLQFLRLVPALGAHEPVQPGVVFMPAVGAGGGYFVVSHVKKGVQNFHNDSGIPLLFASIWCGVYGVPCTIFPC